jgi:tRNA threonylcarbamoyl adenosine modification protein YjeE
MQLSRKFVSEKNYLVPDLTSLKEATFEIAKQLEIPVVLLLFGDLGAGKTQFARYLVEALGGEEVQSPSFSLENVYQGKHGPIHHFDLYRLESEEEVETSGLWDAFSENGVVMIEWAERLRLGDLPMDWNQIEILFEDRKKLKVKVYAAAE